MTAYREMSFQLKDHVTGARISTTGGNVIVTAAGDPAKATLYDPENNYASLSNPISLDSGEGKFAIAKATETVDLYIFSPTGHCVVLQDVKVGSLAEVAIDSGQLNSVWVVPFSMDDMTANTEYDFGINLPAGMLVLPNPSIKVITVDATETLDVGILASESNGDADGFIDGLSVAAAGIVQATLADGAATVGTFLHVDESAGDLVPEAYPCDGTATSLSGTLSAGSDTAEGLILLPVVCGNLV